jgi:ubiquinone/menaquinone biosynthesis C-methylase UbiE
MQPSTDAFQLSLTAAELYESRFVPALFAEWAPHLLDAARLPAGASILDVACGTGIVARTAADRPGAGRVVGVDVNAAMLTVARRVRPDIEWREGDVARLPFPDASFDAALCQMALMFFPDRAKALAEMARVVTSGGTVAVVVPAGLALQPAYGPFVEIAARHAGPEALSLLGTYWACGDVDELRTLFQTASLEIAELSTRLGTARFESIDALVTTEVESTPLIDRITEDIYRRIRRDASQALRRFTTPSGEATIPFAAHVVVSRKPAR